MGFVSGAMKLATLFLATAVFVAAASITFTIIHWLKIGDPGLAFVAGAILGTQAGSLLHHRTPDAANTMGVKCLLGAVLAVTAALFGVALHVLFAPFKFAEITIPISAIGTFFFPFVIFNTMWSTMSQSRKKRQ